MLFEAYTERMLAHRPGPFTPAQTLAWLAWLARSMRHRNQSEFHLDRLHPGWLPTTIQQRLATLSPAITGGLVVGLVGGLADGLVHGPTHGLTIALEIGLFLALFFGLRQTEDVGWSWLRVRTGAVGGLVVGLFTALIDGPIFGLERGLRNGLAFALVFALVFVLFARLRKTEPVEEVRWSWAGVRAGVRTWPVLGLGGGLVYGLTNALVYGPVHGLANGLFAGLVVGLVGVVVHGLASGLIDERTSPNEGVRRSARHALAIGLAFSLFVGLGGGLVFALVFHLVDGVGDGLCGGLAVGLLFGGLACLQHLSLRGLLASRGCAPLRYVRFLDDATERLFLRRAGGGYLFVHRLLLEYFADLETTRPPATAEPPVSAQGSRSRFELIPEGPGRARFVRLMLRTRSDRGAAWARSVHSQISANAQRALPDTARVAGSGVVSRIREALGGATQAGACPCRIACCMLARVDKGECG